MRLWGLTVAGSDRAKSATFQGPNSELSLGEAHGKLEAVDTLLGYGQAVTLPTEEHLGSDL